MSWLRGFCQWVCWWFASPQSGSEGSPQAERGCEAAGVVDAAMTALSRPTGPTPCIVVMNDEAGDWARLYWLLVFAGRSGDAGDVTRLRAMNRTFWGTGCPGNSEN